MTPAYDPKTKEQLEVVNCVNYPKDCNGFGWQTVRQINDNKKRNDGRFLCLKCEAKTMVKNR